MEVLKYIWSTLDPRCYRKIRGERCCRWCYERSDYHSRNCPMIRREWSAYWSIGFARARLIYQPQEDPSVGEALLFIVLLVATSAVLLALAFGG